MFIRYYELCQRLNAHTVSQITVSVGDKGNAIIRHIQKVYVPYRLQNVYYGYLQSNGSVREETGFWGFCKFVAAAAHSFPHTRRGMSLYAFVSASTAAG